MRYIGGKSLLKKNILNLIKEVAPDAKTVIDLFSGSGVVSKAFKEENYDVISNDYLYFSYVLIKGNLECNSKPKFKKLGFDPIKYLNRLRLEDTNIKIEDCFIYNNYSPTEKCERMYFQNHNAIKIDIIRQTIEKWYVNKKISKKEYFYLLASLISAVPYDDFYNQGIVDVSYEYPKMYVIRPQFFISLISILRNSAYNAYQYKIEMNRYKAANIDVTNFEKKLNDFKDGFVKNYMSASNNFDEAIKDIDATIKKMESIKAHLLTTQNQLRLANNKVDEVSVKKLTYNNPTMKKLFDEARNKDESK